jgi:hypothetical protein
MFRTWLLARFTEVYRPQAEASAAPRIYAKCLDGDNALICQRVHAALGHATSIPTPRTDAGTQRAHTLAHSRT